MTLLDRLRACNSPVGARPRRRWLAPRVLVSLGAIGPVVLGVTPARLDAEGLDATAAVPPLRLAAGTFAVAPTPDGAGPAVGTMAAGSGAPVVVTYAAPPTTADRARLVAAGARLFTFLPEASLLVRLPAGLAAETLPGVRAVAPWRAEHKLAAGARQALRARAAAAVDGAGEAAGGGGGTMPVLVHLFPDVAAGPLRQALGELGLGAPVGVRDGGRFARLRLLATPAQLLATLDAVAARPEVFFVELEGRRTLLNDTTIWVGQSGTAGGMTTPIFDHGIYGEGQVVAVLDTGLDADMCYFADPVEGLPPANPCDGGTVVNPDHRKVLAVDFLWSSECASGIAANEWDTHDHGSHVAGTVAGDNLASLLLHDAGDGMAPGAKLVIQDGGLTTDNCADLPGIGCPVVDLVPIFAQTYAQGARIHSNSWGDNENASVQNNYTAASEDVDRFSWDHRDFQIVFAAGNSGDAVGSVSSPSTAKSVLSVGSTLRGSSAGSMSSFSGCGPTDDARRKPDVTAPGSSIISANSDNNVASSPANCNTRSMSGTSMATPAVAGLAALVREYFADGFYPTGAASAEDAFAPTSALVRAMVVGSGRPMSGVSGYPANCQGWGRVTLDEVLLFSGDTERLWALDERDGGVFTAPGEVASFEVEVAAGDPLELTLAWTDYPSTPAASVHLVNDLDLEVVAPDGTYLGNVFSAGQSATGGSADRRNTIERVRRDSPVAGTYMVTVRAHAIPQGPQPFALVGTGRIVPRLVFADGFESGEASRWDVGP